MTDKVGERSKVPGAKMMPIGIALLVLGVILLIVNLASTVTEYIPGLGEVTRQGSPSIGAIALIIVGLLLAGIGFARRLLAAVERR